MPIDCKESLIRWMNKWPFWHNDDYPRIVAMDDPLVKPLSGMKDIMKYSQHFVDDLLPVGLARATNHSDTCCLNYVSDDSVGKHGICNLDEPGYIGAHDIISLPAIGFCRI